METHFSSLNFQVICSNGIISDFISTEDLPIHVKEELRRLNDKQEEERKQKELDKSICKVSKNGLLGQE